MILLIALTLTALADEPAVEAPIDTPTPTQSDPDADAARFRVTVIPGLGLNADPDSDVDGISVGLVGRAKNVKGVDGQAFLSWIDEDTKGAQLSGFVSVAGGSIEGVQGAGFINYAGDADLQGAGFVSVASGDIRYGQLSGFTNIATGNVTGVQGSGFLNIATGEEFKGVQASGGLNVSGDLEGVQAGIVNVGKEVNGVQAGLLNVGEKTSGLSLGLVNVAKESDAVTIAPLNFIGNGIHNIDIWASESSAVTADVKFGGKYIYTLIGAGTVRIDDPWWTFGFGMGVHIPAKLTWLEVDASTWGIASGGQLAPGAHTKLRGSLGLNLSKHFQPFVGASANTWWSDGSVRARAVGLPVGKASKGRITSWPGVHAGIQF